MRIYPLKRGVDHSVGIKMGVKKVDNTSRKGNTRIVKQSLILGIMIIIAAFGGCIGQENNMNTGLAGQNTNNSDITQNGIDSNVIEDDSTIGNNTDINQISLMADSTAFNTTGRLRLSLKITNPIINETVLTVLNPEFMSQWDNETTITKIKDDQTWIRNYSVRPGPNTTYIKMLVQVSENNTVVKRASWNITGWAPAGGLE